jgi:DNA-binding NtrC family response regulator
VEAYDGQDAWNQFLRQPDRFDLLLTDVVMPRVPGTVLAAGVHGLRPELPVVIMTGYTPTELLERGLQASHGELLTKPLEPGRLLATVSTALEAEMADEGRDLGRQRPKGLSDDQA